MKEAILTIIDRRIEECKEALSGQRQYSPKWEANTGKWNELVTLKEEIQKL